MMTWEAGLLLKDKLRRMQGEEMYIQSRIGALVQQMQPDIECSLPFKPAFSLDFHLNSETWDQ